MAGYTLEEVEAVISMLGKHIEKLKRAENRSLRLGIESSWLAIKQWRIALTALLGEAEAVMRMLSEGHDIASSRQACITFNRVNRILNSMDSYGQIALGSRYILVSLAEAMRALCYSS
jgi:hypothetical protein